MVTLHNHTYTVSNLTEISSLLVIQRDCEQHLIPCCWMLPTAGFLGRALWDELRHLVEHPAFLWRGVGQEGTDKILFCAMSAQESDLSMKGSRKTISV